MSTDPALEPNLDAQNLSLNDWKQVLTPIEFAILREHGTERPGTGRYLNEERPGAYHCAGCGQRLYDGNAKFHSGCGWPSFFQEVEPGAIRTLTDTSHGMVRTEMRCARCDGHLGHIFKDAPHQPTGLRHCVNGFALVFVPDGEDPAEVLANHRQSG
ncbi:MAG: peptide-methionine (R)-S-oxide reductase MsrB [Myxococcota bacterium]